MADKPRELIDLMAQVAPFGEGESGFGKRLGPTEQCFSPRDLVNGFEWGASQRASAHISECEFCAKWVHNYSQRPAKYLRVAAAAQGGSASWFSNLLGRRQQPQPDPAIALLLAGDCVINVAEPGASLPDVSVPVVAGLTKDVCSRIDVASLQLEGLIASCDATLEPPNPGGEWWSQYPIIRFKGVRQGGSHLDFNKSFGFTDKVRVTGRFKDSADQFFLGQAIVTLKKS